MPDMQFSLFKREVYDDQLLEGFLSSHSLLNNEYNITAVKEFAENSIETPVDFKDFIINLKKYNVSLPGFYNLEEKTEK
jgi:hypothetical protein